MLTSLRTPALRGGSFHSLFHWTHDDTTCFRSSMLGSRRCRIWFRVSFGRRLILVSGGSGELRTMGMSDKEDSVESIHISPVGKKWDVESDLAPLGQADTKSEALELAKESAREKEASIISIHTSDGQVEEQIRLRARTQEK